MDLSIIIVNYNNFRVLRDCLPTLMPAIDGLDVEILLSDNGSGDGSLEWIEREYPTIRIIRNGQNLGFAEGNNRALPHARGDHLLLLNPDTLIVGDAIRTMLHFLREHSRVGAVGCKLLAPDGTRQVSARRFPTLLTYFLQFSGLAYRFPRHPFFGAYNLSFWDGETARSVDWICGAALMFRREVLEKAGPLDPEFFLTYDEVDFCHRIKDAGFEVWYIPQAQIIHLEGQSAPQADFKPQGRMKYLTVERNSRFRYFRKHHGLLYAVLVEDLHLLLNGLLLLKAWLLGTKQPTLCTLDRELLMRIYWDTLGRVPRAAAHRVSRAAGLNDAGKKPFKVFHNPLAPS
jgi:GT2 family glycosyltransferase